MKQETSNHKLSIRIAENVYISVNISSQNQLLNYIYLHAKQHRGCAIATLNMDHLYKLIHDPKFLEAYQCHSYVTADGFPVQAVARMFHVKINRVTGADLVRPVLALAESRGLPIAFFGTSASSLSALERILAREFPAISIVFSKSPGAGFEPEGEEARCFLQEIARSNAKVCFIALGAPKQEIFASIGLAEAPNTIFISVGAALDFISGAQTRAPKILRVLFLEWAWRLICSPRRMGIRYWRCLLLIKELVRRSVVS